MKNARDQKRTFASYIRYDEKGEPYLDKDAPEDVKKLYDEYFISDEENCE